MELFTPDRVYYLIAETENLVDRLDPPVCTEFVCWLQMNEWILALARCGVTIRSPKQYVIPEVPRAAI
jgi:hypothetical protein